MRDLQCGSYPFRPIAKLVSLSWKSMGSGSPSRASRAASWSEGVQHPGISSFGRKEHQRAGGNKAGIVLSGPALNVLDLLGEVQLLSRHPLFARSTLDLFTVHVVQVPMELFTQLFGGLLLFVYHCFDRIAINGYLNGLSQPDQAVQFFRLISNAPILSNQVLAQITDD